MKPEQLQFLLEKELLGQLSPVEQAELDAAKLLMDEPLLVAAMVQAMEAVQLLPVAVSEAADNEAVAVIMNTDTSLAARIVPRRFFTRRIQVAAVLLALAAGAWLFFMPQRRTGKPVPGRPLAGDIAPAVNKARLIVGNGAPIDLSSQQPGIQVGKNITYTNGEVITAASQTLTLSVPKGGRYQVTLPDGSRVWLNADTRLQFPSTFTGNKRELFLAGEAYFEIAADASKAFVLHAGGQQIEVLGTGFNVNAYANEPVTTTTLVTGKVKVLNDHLPLTPATLQPGEQAKNHAGGAIQLGKANMDAVLAWKNGIFHFDNADIYMVMRQLERWYDIEVVFEGAQSQARFQGEVGGQLQLREVLEILTESKVKYRLEGRKLIIE